MDESRYEIAQHTDGKNLLDKWSVRKHILKRGAYDKPIYTTEDKSEAEFICKAANNHDKLVEALDYLAGSLRMNADLDGAQFDALEQAKAVLAEVKDSF